MSQSSEERFWSKVVKTDTCWLWTGCVSEAGYGRLTVKGRPWWAHRFAYEMLVGPIPEGLHLDHVVSRGCTNRNCVNPAHLEPVTRGENSRRGRAGKVNGALQQAKTHCPSGHEYSHENTKVKANGHRGCKMCNRLYMREYRSKAALADGDHR